MDWEESFGKELSGFLTRRQFIFNAPMSEHTTFKIGGAADVLIFPSTSIEVASISSWQINFNFPAQFWAMVQMFWFWITACAELL